MKEVVQRFPPKVITDPIYIGAILFASYQVAYIAKVLIAVLYFLKSRHVYVQMYWLLVEKEYIIVFVYIISTIVHYAVWITSSKWLTKEFSKTWAMLAKPRPKGIVIKFIYSNHV